jgi:hypothetical protein
VRFGDRESFRFGEFALNRNATDKTAPLEVVRVIVPVTLCSLNSISWSMLVFTP